MHFCITKVILIVYYLIKSTHSLCKRLNIGNFNNFRIMKIQQLKNILCNLKVLCYTLPYYDSHNMAICIYFSIKLRFTFQPQFNQKLS